MSLAAPERETVITFSDADELATVHTHSRRVITKLRKNPAAMQMEDISFDGTAGAVFTIPKALISFRSKRVHRPGAGAHLRKHPSDRTDSTGDAA